jgi:hypothetical protein
VTPPQDLASEAVELWRDHWPDDGYMQYAHSFTVVSFPMMFGSTSGPFGGIGGAAMTNFKIDVYTDVGGGKAIVFANGRFWKTVTHFKFDHNISASRN